MSARAWLVETHKESAYFRQYQDARSVASAWRKLGVEVLSGPRVVYGDHVPVDGWSRAPGILGHRCILERSAEA